MLEHGWIDSPEIALLLDALPAQARVVEVGCGVGAFALAAAAAGADVIAIDSVPTHVDLVRAAARRNRFDRLRVICASSVEGIDMDQVDAVMLRVGIPEALRVALDRPSVVFFGELRNEVARLGRDVLMIDEVREGVLVATSPTDPQPSAASAYAMLDATPSGWRVEPPLDADRRRSRVIDEASSPSATRRLHAARLLGACTHPAAAATQTTLAIDIEPQVRAGMGRAASKPAADPRPSLDETVVLAASLSLPAGLSDGHFHVRAGQYVGVVAAADEPAGGALIEAIAGIGEPHQGTLEVLARPTLVRGLADAVQAGLSVAQNLELLAAFLGADVSAVDRHMSQLARDGGFAEALPQSLEQAGSDVAARVMLCAALHCASGPLLLIDGLPALDSPALRQRTERHVRELLRHGTSIIQRVHDPSGLIARPDRLMWIHDGRILHNGHAESIAAASIAQLAGSSA